jgi:hypothetical protein
MKRLRELENLVRVFGATAAARKLALLDALARTRLAGPAQVLRLHEALCFLRAYPDNPRVLRTVEDMLAAFDKRPDLRHWAADLESSGIAGTEILFPFYDETARWLVRRWPDRVTIEWDQIEASSIDWLGSALELLVLPAEVPAVDEYGYSLDEWIERLKHPDETDAAFLVRRLATLPAALPLRQFVYEQLKLWLRIHSGTNTPSRTRAMAPRHVAHWQTTSLTSARPDLKAALRAPPLSVRALSPRQGARYLELAREAMATRSRDLDAFAYGDPADVRLVDYGDGLEFVAIGMLPERRLLLEAVYGFLTLRNGVPIGYVLNSALYGSAEIAYNVFDTFRGADAAYVYGRVVSMVHHVFGADAFTIYPYQLGHDNAEGLASGAWWFYQKLGFRPHDESALALMERELARMRRHAGHRSSIATLQKLARENVYWHRGRGRADVMGQLPLANAGLAVSAMVTSRFAVPREAASRILAREAAGLLGVRSQRGWTPGERLAWRRWAPLVMTLPGVVRWSSSDHAALVAVIRAKGGRRESDFVLAFDRHQPLRKALRRLVTSFE